MMGGVAGTLMGAYVGKKNAEDFIKLLGLEIDIEKIRPKVEAVRKRLYAPLQPAIKAVKKVRRSRKVPAKID